jgi:hypothetical protein
VGAEVEEGGAVADAAVLETRVGMTPPSTSPPRKLSGK